MAQKCITPLGTFPVLTSPALHAGMRFCFWEDALPGNASKQTVIFSLLLILVSWSLTFKMLFSKCSSRVFCSFSEHCNDHFPVIEHWGHIAEMSAPGNIVTANNESECERSTSVFMKVVILANTYIRWISLAAAIWPLNGSSMNNFLFHFQLCLYDYVFGLTNLRDGLYGIKLLITYSLKLFSKWTKSYFKGFMLFAI